MSTLKTHSTANSVAVHAQDLSAFNTLGLPALARYYVSLDHLHALPTINRYVHEHGQACILGGGSNVVLPREIDSLIVHVGLRGISAVSRADGGWMISAAAGENWHAFVGHCVGVGFHGLENLALIPGQVGAAPVQNIGAYGLEVAQYLHSVTAWDFSRNEVVEMSAAQCAFGYRDSRFKHESDRWIILSVQFLVPEQWQARLDYPDLQRYPGLNEAATVTPRAVFDAVCDIRRSKLPDPAVVGNAGSFFKNPVVEARQFAQLKEDFPGLVAYGMPGGQAKLAAGWLIDQAGWKGRRVGRAAVHDRQALVLTNAGGADADDIGALANAIRQDVHDRYGIWLEPEPVFFR